MDELERRLRSGLAARAGDVTPDPRTWGIVRERLRRGQLLRWGAGLATATAVIVALAIALPQLGGTTVRFPEVADQVTESATEPADATPTTAPATTAPTPSPSPTASTPPASGSRVPSWMQQYCPEGEPLVFVSASQVGDLRGTCADGSQQPVVQTDGVIEEFPHFSPDGTLLAFHRRAEGSEFGALMVLDLRDGSEQEVVAGGQEPSFGPGGQLAYIDDVLGDERQPRIVVRPDVTGRARLSQEGGPGTSTEALRFPATALPDGVLELTARHLTWDPTGDRLWWEAGYEGFGLHTAELTGERVLPLQVEAGPDVERLLAPATAEAGSVVAIRQQGGVEGAPVEDLEFGRVSLTGRVADGAAEASFESILGLNELPAPLDPVFGRFFMTAAGFIGVEQDPGAPFRVVQGDAPAWLVGDGSQTYLIAANGDIDNLKSSWTDVAANPTIGRSRE